MSEGKLKFYVVYGDPIALARSRYARGRFYDAQKHIKLTWGIDISRQHDNEPMFSGPIGMDVIFYMPIAKSTPKTRAESIKDQWHIFKPDSSNLLKFVEDAATEICFKDDCIIVKQTIEKVYDDGKGPRTEFTFYEIKGLRKHRELK